MDHGAIAVLARLVVNGEWRRRRSLGLAIGSSWTGSPGLPVSLAVTMSAELVGCGGEVPPSTIAGRGGGCPGKGV